MEMISRKSSTVRVRITALFFLAVLGLSVLLATYAQAASQPTLRFGQRLITVHDRGRDRGILTTTSTLRQMFEENDIHLDPNDRVEPGIDEPLVATNYDVNIYRARPVTIVDGNTRTKVMSPHQTASQIAKQAGVKLQKEDATAITANSDMVSQGAGVQLTIDRAVPVQLVLYGNKTMVYTHTTTVADLLKEKEVTIGKEDTVSVPLDTKTIKGMTIEVWRNGSQIITVEEDVDFAVREIQDADQPIGYRKVEAPGEKGKRKVTYEITRKNGQEVSRAEIQSIVLSEPKEQVEVVGTKPSNSFSGDFAEALARLRSCEGSYTSNTGNGYYGAYQFDISTWGGHGGYANASLAPPAVQDEKAWLTYQRRGWQPWPSCSRSMGLQDIYR